MPAFWRASGRPIPSSPAPTWPTIIVGFDLSRFGRATAKFDPAELVQINVKIVQQRGFDDVAGRLGSLDVGGGEAFWLAVRDNVSTVAEAAHWWRVCTTPLAPVIDAADVTAAAAAHLPDGDLDGVWGAWTKSVSASDRCQGARAFHADPSGPDRTGEGP